MSSAPDRRVAYDARTGILIVVDGHNAVHGSVDEMEDLGRLILRAALRQRLKAYETEWPKPPALIDEF